MKKTKRIIALVMALTLMFAFMAMSASAASTEIQPRATCSKCGSGNTATGSRSTVHNVLAITECSNMAHPHLHVTYYERDFYQCRNCGYEYEYNKLYPTRCQSKL